MLVAAALAAVASLGATPEQGVKYQNAVDTELTVGCNDWQGSPDFKAGAKYNYQNAAAGAPVFEAVSPLAADGCDDSGDRYRAVIRKGVFKPADDPERPYVCPEPLDTPDLSLADGEVIAVLSGTVVAEYDDGSVYVPPHVRWEQDEPFVDSTHICVDLIIIDESHQNRNWRFVRMTDAWQPTSYALFGADGSGGGWGSGAP